MNDSLARCVLDEILPELEQHKTPDGLAILLSKDRNDRCTGGGSTGAIAAFTLAWERPDAFSRVFTSIGTFVGMRGGDRYPVLIRKTEPKPLRIFMQDGSNDEWMGGPEVGDWWMSNQTVERGLEFAGYQVNHVWGTGVHSPKHATLIFPDAMRYLWKDWPQPIKAGESQNVFLKAILDPGESWQATTDVPSGPTTDADAAAKKIEGIHADHAIVTHAGFTYGTESGTGDADGKVWLIKPDGGKQQLDQRLNHPAGMAISPDGLWLAVLENKTHFGYSYRVKSDGTVEEKQKFYWLHIPDWADDSGAGDICFDRDGRLYVATRMGVQVLDRNGRSRAILPLPLPSQEGQATRLYFGGKDFDTLYVTAGGKTFARKMKSRGIPASEKPIKLPPWGAG